MLHTNVMSTARPDSVVVEQRDGDRRVLLRDNIEEITTTEDEIEQTTYLYDEVVFLMPEDREETIESITSNFASWWAYGAQPEEPAPTLEERVQALEDVILMGI